MSESGGSEIEEVGGGGGGPGRPPPHYFPVSRQETEQDHSRLLSSSFSWDPHQSSNFTSTLDIEAIKVSHSAGPSELLSLSSLADNWDHGPPRLEPHVERDRDRDRALPKLEAMDQDSSSESESDDRSGSESDSGSNDGSSSSSCSSIETDSSTDNDDQQQVESSKKSSKRPSSKPGCPVSEVPSQSCPSPPVLFKNTELRGRRQSGGSQAPLGKKHSSSSLKQSSSTSKKTNAKSHRKEYLAISNNEALSESGSEKEEVSITNNISEIFHNKRDSQVVPEARPELRLHGPSSPPNCDLDICDKTADYDHCMPTLQSFSEDVEMASLPASSRMQTVTKDILEDTEDSDCVILDSRMDTRGSPGDSKYKHKQSFIQGIYGKTQDKVSPKKSDSNRLKKHWSQTDSLNLSEGSLSGSEDDEEDSDSSSVSSVSSCPKLTGEVSSVSSLSDAGCDNNSSSDSSSAGDEDDDSPPPPLLEPQIPELKKRKLKENLSKNVVLKPKLKDRARPKNMKNHKKVECGSQTEETAFPRTILPSSSSSSSHLVQSKESYKSLSSGPPLLSGFGAQSSKLNRGRPRKNPPTLQPQIETKKDGFTSTSTSTWFPDDQSESTDETADEREEKMKKKDKLSVLFGAAKHWQRQQENFKAKSAEAEEADCYEFTEEVSEKEENSGRSSVLEESEKDTAPEFCDKKHSKAINLKYSNKKTKHKKRFTATPEKVKKYKRIHHLAADKQRERERAGRTKTKIERETSDEEKTDSGLENKQKAAQSNGLTEDVDYFSFRDQKTQQSRELHKNQVESDASSCFEDFVNSSKVKRELKPCVDGSQKIVPTVYQQFSTKVNNNFGKTAGLIFSKKYCTLKPEAFWKMSKRKLSTDEFREAKLELHTSELKQEPAAVATSSVFATKASLKEMPNVPRNQVQQMVNVLASAGRFQNKVSKKKKEKDERKSYRDSRTKNSYETAYETQSEDEEGSIKKKNKKIWKSKHKNVVDPVFLGELEHLIRDIATCQLEMKLSTHFWPDRPSDCVPSIFKRRKIFTTRRRRDLNKITKRGKNSRHVESAIEILDLTSENDEQRLPLKKRHHHLQGDGEKVDLNTSFEDVDIEPLNPTQALIQIKTPEKICREYGRNPDSKLSDFSDSNYSALSLRLLQDNLIKKPTAADRIVEKLGLGVGVGIQIKKENSNSRSRNDSNMEKNGRGVRRISKDLQLGGGNSSKKEQNKVPAVQIKQESKLKSGDAEEGRFVLNMKDCIDKYTASSSLEKNKLKQSAFHPRDNFKGQNFSSNKHQRSRKSGSKNSPFVRSSSGRQSQSQSQSYIPILSSPEPEITICSGRESSLSQSSSSSDSCSVINIDAADQVESPASTQEKISSRLGRSSRQDLHSHLWRHEKSRAEPKSGYQSGTARPASSDSAGQDWVTLDQHQHLQPSKPLPTEPIRRVDLGPLGGYCNKPGFGGSQECVIKKVPQAIVAPFRRQPPETSAPVSQVVPIHRASISHSGPAATTDSGGGSSLATTTTTSSTSTSSTSTSTSTNYSSSSAGGGGGGVKLSAPTAKEMSSHLSGEELERKQGEIDVNKSGRDNLEIPGGPAGPAKIKKCQVAVERLRQPAGLLVSKTDQSDQSQHQHPLVTETPSRRPGSIKDIKESAGVSLENCEKSDSTLNIVSRDKTTKENKCSPRNLEVAISGKKGDFGGNNSAEVSGGQERSSDNCSVNGTINLNNSDRAGLEQQPQESKVKTKKRRRRTNKTGFPCKIRKKKKLSQPLDQSEDFASITKVESNLLPSAASTSVETSKTRGGIFDNLDTFKISSANIDLEPKKQTYTGRPLRECRAQDVAETEGCSPDPLTSLTKKRSSTSTPERGRGRPSKRPKVSQSRISPFKKRSSGSVDPSPASSDVESMDCRSFLEEEMEADSLTTLPSSEDNLLSPSLAESSEVQTEEKKKKSKPSNIIKKNFLQAGLFSYDYKSESRGKVGQENLIKSTRLMYRPEEHPFSLLPPPYYCGRQLRQKKEDFALPFDLWQLHSTQSLPNRDIIATWNYKRIKANVFYDVKPTPNFEPPACHCKPPSEPRKAGCGDKCLNRMTYTECDPESCPLGDIGCTNMVIQKHLSSVVVQRFMTNEKGFGIRTKTHINPGSFIMEYLGEVVTDKEFKRRMASDYQKDSHHYCLHVGEGVVIDGYRMGGECRYVNHSCNPNCEMQKWSVNGMWRMALFSKASISAYEELTYDYNFSLFNPHEGQTCHCGASECRGVIGGKGKKVAQQKSSKPGRPSKDSKSSKSEQPRSEMQKESKMHKQPTETKYPARSSGEFLNKSNLNHFAPLKPMTAAQQQFCRRQSVLLLRNLEKIRKLRDLYLKRGNLPAVSTQQKSDRKVAEQQRNNSFTQTEVFKAGLTALTTARSVQTRRLALAQDNPDVSKVVQIAKTFQEILDALNSLKTEDGQESLLTEFLKLPAKEDSPQYYCNISEPIDLSSISGGLSSGSYHSVAQIDQDILLLFQNMTRFYGRTSRLGQYAAKLRGRYLHLALQNYSALLDLVGEEAVRCLARSPPAQANTETEDIINCPCGQYKDEGVMVQCDTCSCWQHTDCISLDTEPDQVENFVCYKCSGDQISLDIPLVPQPEFASSGETYYVSLSREDGMQLTLGTTVYVLRAFKPSEAVREEENKNIVLGHGGVPHKSISPIKGPSKEAASMLSGSYPTYKTVSPTASTADMDIFRVERLWINEAGQKFAFGYHYLRPHETFHEPSRKFFDNEVFRVPIYEVLPIDSIYGRCWVMDPVTFCRGRPNECEEEHVYICEHRVDKTARLFNKISKHKHPTCTKFYAFTEFDLRLKLTRSYTPHQVGDRSVKAGRSSREPGKLSSDISQGSGDTSMESNSTSCKLASTKKSKQKRLSMKVWSKTRKSESIEVISKKLLSAHSQEDSADLSGLLEGMKRKRNRTTKL